MSYLSSKTESSMEPHSEVIVAFRCGHQSRVSTRCIESFVEAFMRDIRKHYRKDNIIRLFGRKKTPKSLDDLWSNTTPRYVDMPIQCEQETCRKFDLKDVERRPNKMIYKIDRLWNDSIFDYKNLGIRYHNVPPACRAKYANHSECSLAHQQYGIERRIYLLDPFFKELREMELQLFEAADLIDSKKSPSEHHIRPILHKLNYAKALHCSVLIEKNHELLTGVEFLEKMVREEKFKEQISEIPNPFGRRKRTTREGKLGKMKLMQAPSAMPTLVFEMATYKIWKDRLEGLIGSRRPRIRKRLRTEVDLDDFWTKSSDGLRGNL